MAYQSNNSGSFINRHEKYYITGGDLFVLVEGVLFRIHRYFFERESPRFRAQLTRSASGPSRHGSCESNAIILDNVRSADFAKFLGVFYNPNYSSYEASFEDWTVIFHLAWAWSFSEVIKLADRELDKLAMNSTDRWISSASSVDPRIISASNVARWIASVSNVD